MRRILGLSILKDTRARRGNLQPKKGKNLPQVLFQSCTRSKKKRRKRESSTYSSSSREVSAEVTLYPAKKKKYGKKRRRNHSTTSWDSSSSDGNDSDDSQHARFKIVTEDEKFKSTLPKGMASYTNKYFEQFIPERDLKEAILSQSPLPENMDTVKKIRRFP